MSQLMLPSLLALLGAAALLSAAPSGLLVARAAVLAVFAASQYLSVSTLLEHMPSASLGSWLGYDELAALFVPLTAMVACATLFGSPSAELTPRARASVLLSLASAVIALCARDLLAFTGGWVLGLVAVPLGLARSTGRFRSAFLRYATLGTLPLLMALFVLAGNRGFSFVPAAPDARLSISSQHLVFILLALAAAFRSGLLPLHSWLPALTERAPVPVSAMLFGAPLGPVLVARAIVPLTPAVAQGDLSSFSTWAILSALYAALLALVQGDLKRTLGFVLTSQSALLLFGVSGASAESMHGALLGVIATGLGAAGLLLLGAALSARVGTSQLARLHGEGRLFGRMAALFFLTAAASIGLPGSLAFVSEDLLLHGLLHSNPKGALLLLLVTVLNGISLLRLYFHAFQGPAAKRQRHADSDLNAREGLVVATLLAVTFVAGFSPQLFISLQEQSVRVLSTRSADPSSGLSLLSRPSAPNN